MGHVQKLSTFLFVLALALLWGGSVRAASFPPASAWRRGALEPSGGPVLL